MNIQVHIERLMVDGSLGLDSSALEAAVIEGLSRALMQQPGLPLLQQGGSLAALHGGTVQFQGPPSSWGDQLGHSVHATLAAGAQGDWSATNGVRQRSGGPGAPAP